MTAEPGRVPEVLGVIGTGLMGGSLGLAALASGAAGRVIGYDTDPAMLAHALEVGAISQPATSPAEAAAEATIVVLATPVGAIPAAFRAVAPGLRGGTIVTDVGSAKARIVGQISPLVPPGVHFVGGHPLAGSEKEGVGAADPAMFTSAFWILTPTAETDPEAYGRLVRFLGTMGVHVLALDPARHDELVALTSHLPQLISSTLMEFAADLSSAEGGVPLIGAGGFRDMTRLAGSSPRIWVDILQENRAAVLGVLEQFRTALAATAEYIETGDWAGLAATFEAARDGRARLPEKPGLVASALIEVVVPVADRPNALAEVTTTIGEAGVNIEDLTIAHASAGGRGAIHLWISGDLPAQAAVRALEQRGLHPRRADADAG